jgi:hypothetical protein
MNFLQVVTAARRIPVTSGIVTVGLWHNYDAGNASSYPGTGTTWTDLQANNNLTLFGGLETTFVNTPPKHFDFDRVNDYAGTTSWNQPTNDNFTIEAWTRLDAQGNYNQMVFTSQTQNVRTFILFNNRTGATVGTRKGWVFALWDGDGVSSNTLLGANYGSNVASLNTWYHVMCVRDGGTSYIYVNGSLDSTQSLSASTGWNSGTVLDIGKRSVPTVPDYYNGDIAEIRMYNRALNSTEITQNWNATKAKYGY